MPVDRSPGAADPTAPPPSAEGGPQRCFRQLLVCERGINITSWPLHQLGLRLAEHYKGRLAGVAAAEATSRRAAGSAAEGAAALTGQPGAAPGSALAAAAAAAAASQGQQPSSGSSSSGGSGSGSGGGDEDAERELRVVFHRRSSPDQRQLLNAAGAWVGGWVHGWGGLLAVEGLGSRSVALAVLTHTHLPAAELIERCNAWRHTAPGGQRLRARCWQAEPADLFSGLAAAQAADVFVGVHGELWTCCRRVPAGHCSRLPGGAALLRAWLLAAVARYEPQAASCPPLKQAPTWPTAG